MRFGLRRRIPKPSAFLLCHITRKMSALTAWNDVSAWGEKACARHGNDLCQEWKRVYIKWEDLCVEWRKVRLRSGEGLGIKWRRSAERVQTFSMETLLECAVRPICWRSSQTIAQTFSILIIVENRTRNTSQVEMAAKQMRSGAMRKHPERIQDDTLRVVVGEINATSRR